MAIRTRSLAVTIPRSPQTRAWNDEDLAGRVAKGLALEKMPDAPETAAPVQDLKPSPALQLIGKMKDTLMGRTIGILIADGTDGAVINTMNIGQDAGVVNASDKNAFITVAKTRQWDREKSVRTLA